MKITKLSIRNFRSIRSLDLLLGDSTVFIGQNNGGKSAILDAAYFGERDRLFRPIVTAHHGAT